ncbi:hypothetical protein AD006_23805 [Pseudonocardia sp. EC080610-09]|nr:hypothetical protein AD006_23805 [Pseudonocardia sp. EC080610-09]
MIDMLRWRAVLGAVVAASTLTGCTEAAPEPVDPFPHRPYALDVAIVDPCTALTEKDRAALQLRYGSGGTSHGGTSRGCTWPGDNGLGYNLQTFDDKDASVAIAAEPTSQVITLAGFGAVQSSPPAQGTGLPFCQVVLDVADGSSLRAQLQVTPLAEDADRRTVEGTCAQLHAAATTMLENLRTQQGQ